VKHRVRLISILATALLTTAGFSAAQAQTAGPALVGNAAPLSNPLVLKNQVTGAQVQIMPTTQWVAQHPVPAISAPSTTSTTTTTSSSTTCTLATDSSPGDATPLINDSATQNDALDLTSFGLASNGTTITARITAENLADGPGGTPTISGGGDVWILDWTYNSTDYFLYARYPASPADVGYMMSAATSNLPVSIAYGEVGPGVDGSASHNLTAAAGGSFNTATKTITITAPLSGLGHPPTGTGLAGLATTTYALAGVPVKPVGNVPSGLLETADTLNSQSLEYHVGQAPPNCPAPASSAASSGTFPTTASKSNLSYYGGPVVHSIKNYLIWWLPQAGTTTYSNGSSCAIPGTVTYSYEQPTSKQVVVGALPGGAAGDAGFMQIIEQYFRDVGGTGFYNLLTQYADEESGATQNSSSLGGTWTDHCGYTSTPSVTTGPVPGGTAAAPIYQIDIQNEVQQAIQLNHWPTGLGNEYFVYTGYGAVDCFAPPSQMGGAIPACNVADPVTLPLALAGAAQAYCAYHGDFMDPSGNYVLYANMADGAFAANPSSVNLCYTTPIGITDPTHTVTDNGQSISVTDPIADAQVSITSHEQFETVNDAEIGTAQQLAPPLGWYDLAAGEIGDKCAYLYGNYASDGSNITLHGHHYIVQQEYSNWNNGCALTSYAGNAAYGGARDAVSIQRGQTIISVPVSGITTAQALVASMTAAGQLPAGSITSVEVVHNGTPLTYIPGKTASFALNRTDGIIVTSTTAGTWHPAGALYTSAPTIALHAGWNLVAATYPNPGLTTDSIYNQVAQENGACTAAILTNAACSPTITEIKTIGAGGTTVDWRPAATSTSGTATWPQTQGNQIPFTSGMWVYAAKPLTWTVLGAECQSVDASGVCH
jgi:hypothetical protein